MNSSLRRFISRETLTGGTGCNNAIDKILQYCKYRYWNIADSAIPKGCMSAKRHLLLSSTILIVQIKRMHHKCIINGLTILPRQHIIIAKKMPVGSIREWTWRDRHCLFLTLLFLLESALGFDFRRRANVPLHLLWRGSQTKGISYILQHV